MGEGERSEKAGGEPVFRDVRRYYCEHCGIWRSKKSLIASHIQSHHKEEMEAAMARGVEGKERGKANTCEECGATFKKPAYLKQHMQGHSLEVYRALSVHRSSFVVLDSATWKQVP